MTITTLQPFHCAFMSETTRTSR